VLEYKIIYILVIIENITGIPENHKKHVKGHHRKLNVYSKQMQYISLRL